jgi:DNA invertase Pin-like site-specific DNA recombinase
MSDRAKITETQRRRRAVVYVRQSTLHQVGRNTESAARQYALRERAVELGWPAAAVTVVDEDTGQSGASADGRLGFKELVAEVGLGHVGIVLALEVSRFARSSADWHRLLDLCALTATLIADADGVYSPADFNDRLLLGLKGTMSEAELHLIRARLDGGLRNKAKRGELRLALPVGLDRDEDDRIVLCPDEEVRHAILRVFALWRQLGSARQVVMELVADGQKLPRRTVGQRRIRWARPSYGAVHDFLTNPAYAGTFAFGKKRQQKRVDADGQIRVKTIELPVEQWSVCLPEHHPGYVSWDEYLATRARLRANVRPRGEGGGAAGHGNALLQGLIRCGRCGRRMQVAYSGTNGNVPRYLCSAGHVTHATGRICGSLGGTRLDRAVTDAFLEPSPPRQLPRPPARSASSPTSTTPACRASASRSSGRSSRPTARAGSSMPASLSTALSRAPSNADSRTPSARSSASSARSPCWTAPVRHRSPKPSARRSGRSRGTCRGCGTPR